MNFPNHGEGIVQAVTNPTIKYVQKFFHIVQLIIISGNIILVSQDQNKNPNSQQSHCLLIILYITPILLMNQLQIEQQTKERNRKKLIQQNLRLQAQLQKLQKEIQSLEDHFNKKTQEEPQFEQLKAQIQLQQRKIKQIKEVVDAGRQANAKQNMYYIKKEEDQLLWMKQELQNSLKEKEAVHQGHQDKLRKLATNEPLLKHKEEIQKLWNDTKKQNRQNSLKLVQMQRQIRRLHALKEQSKNKNTDSSSEQIQLATLQNEIMRMTSEMKTKQLKWKPNGQVLDNQFFSNKNTLQILVKKCQQLQKEEGVWRLRAAALRDHSQIMTDRERLSKIVAMPKPEPIIKTVNPPKQIIKQPIFVPVIQKQVRDNVRNDKFVDLIRVSSTPTAITNIKQTSKSSQIQPQLSRKSSLHQKVNQQSTRVRKQKSIEQAPLSPSNIKKNQIIFKKQKSLKEPKSNVKQEKNEQVIQVNKNGHNWLGRREKLKSKQTNNAGLAEMIRQKAQQVKKMNKKLQQYQQKDRSVSSPKKKREKQPLNRIKTHSQEKKDKNSLLQSKSKIDISSQLNKQAKRQSSAEKKKNNKQGSALKGPNNNIIQPQVAEANNKKILKSHNTPKRYKQQNLVEKIDISAKINSISVQKSSNAKKINKPAPQIKTPKKQAQTSSNQKQQKIQQIKPKSPASPKAKQKRPVFEIFVSDNPRYSLGQDSVIKPNPINQDVQEDTDGIPKIIKRKRVNEGLVTTGTST